MKEWKIYKLKEIMEITSSKRIFYSEYVPNGIPFYRSKEIIDMYNRRPIQTELYISESRFEEIKEKFGVPEVDNLLLTSVGSLGIPYLVKSKDKFYFKDGNLTWFKNINKDILFPKYFLNWITSQIGKSELDSISIGSTQAALTISGLKDIEIKLPPLSEQKAIASVLSSLDDKIDLLHQQNETLEALAETLFRQWFVEEAKEDWEEKPFSKWIDGTVGGDWGKEKLQGDFTKEVYCIRGTDIADLKRGLPSKTPRRFVKEKKFISIEPKEGDIIIEISGGTENQSTGRAYYINKDVKLMFDKDLVFSNFCRLIRIKNPKYSYFVYLYIKYLYDQDEFFNIENGSSGIKNLDYKYLLLENKYKMPPKELVVSFYQQVNSNFKKINQNKFQIQTLTQLRDTLLPKLMSGGIKVQ